MELLAVSIGLGLAVSLFFSETFGLAAGGMVVPGYVALSLDRPPDVALTVLAGLATYLIVHLLSLSVVIYGKRRTVATILVGYVIGMTVGTLPWELSIAQATGHAELQIIGYIIPGLIAIWIDRQGLVETVSVLVTASVVVRLLLVLAFGTGLHG